MTCTTPSFVGRFLALTLALLSTLSTVCASPLVQYIYLDSLRPNYLSSQAANVSFTECTGNYKIYGHVHSININPCDRATADEPCSFVFKKNYTIEVAFTSYINADQPRSSVIANDEKDGPYAYSGQTFNACKYASCPIKANTPSIYTYHFETLASPFDYLTFNVTSDFDGPSLFCAGTKVRFLMDQQPGLTGLGI